MNASPILKIKKKIRFSKFAFQDNMETSTKNHNNIHNLLSSSHNTEIYSKADKTESNHYI